VTTDFNISELKLAFGLHISQMITDADNKIADVEQVFLETAFPRAELLKAGFIKEEGGTTERFDAAVGEALMRLQKELSTHTKLELIDIFFDLSIVDDEFAQQEGNVIVVAARFLGLTNDELDAHLASREEVGEVDLPEAE